LSKTNCKILTAIGKSYLFQVFFKFEGERLIINFLFGNFISIFLKLDLILSLASFTEVSASHTISIVGKDLLLSASAVIKKLSNQIFITLYTLEIIFYFNKLKQVYQHPYY
jgi:hypothetical protein